MPISTIFVGEDDGRGLASLEGKDEMEGVDDDAEGVEEESLCPGVERVYVSEGELAEDGDQTLPWLVGVNTCVSWDCDG